VAGEAVVKAGGARESRSERHAAAGQEVALDDARAAAEEAPRDRHAAPRVTAGREVGDDAEGAPEAPESVRARRLVHDGDAGPGRARLLAEGALERREAARLEDDVVVEERDEVVLDDAEGEVPLAGEAGERALHAEVRRGRHFVLGEDASDRGLRLGIGARVDDEER